MPDVAITYPLAFPIRRTTNFSFALAPTVAVTKSPFSGSSQVLDWGNEPWMVSFDAIPVGKAEWGQLTAFVSALRGRAGTTLIGPRQAVRPRGTCNTAGVTVATGGAAAKARALPLAGLGSGKTLLQGDFLQLGSGDTSRVHMVVQDATADGSGNATISIEPPLRSSYLAGAAVTLIEPKCIMRSETNIMSGQLQLGRTMPISFSFAEAL